ncbi:MAG: hypothetical protein Tsb0013_18910 [Phycisphaerales bacterium]
MTAAPAQLDQSLPIEGAPRRSLLDALGIGLSALCMVHCLALPALLVALPQLSSVMGLDHSFHVVLAVVLPLIAGLALVQGYLRHRVPMTLVLGGLGLAFVWLALAVPGCETCTHDHAGHEHAHAAAPAIFGLPLHNVVTSVGSILLISAHAMNWRACRSGPCKSGCHTH